MKLLVMTTLLLCAPAVAEPSPAQVSLDFTIEQGSASRTHQLLLLEDGCGTVFERTDHHTDAIEVCVSNADDKLDIVVDWSVHEGPIEYRTHWEAVVAHGATVEVGHTGAITLAMQVQ